MKAFAFDIDGVLIRGGRALAGAVPALNLLNRKKIPWIVLTNGGGMSEQDRVTNLSSKLGQISISPLQFLQSHTPFRDFVGNRNRVLVVGGDSDRCRHVAREYGFRDVVIPSDIVQTVKNIVPFPSLTSKMPGAVQFSNPEKPFDGIFVFHDSRDATADTQLIIDLLVSQGGVLGTRKPLREYTSRPSVPIYFSNADMQWVTDYSQPRFGQGALIAMVKELYRGVTGHDLEHTVIGKPTRLTYEYADRLLSSWSKEPIDKIYMIGDNQHSDILGANNYGWESVLVRSGVYQEGDELFTNPTFICDDVLEAVNTALNG